MVMGDGGCDWVMGLRKWVKRVEKVGSPHAMYAVDIEGNWMRYICPSLLQGTILVILGKL